jgi:hypothetical protein
MSEENDEPRAPLSEDERRALIEEFEANAFATFRLGEDRDAFDTLIDYIRKNQIATYTDVDKAAGTVTVTKRPFGSLELG